MTSAASPITDQNPWAPNRIGLLHTANLKPTKHDLDANVLFAPALTEFVGPLTLSSTDDVGSECVSRSSLKLRTFGNQTIRRKGSCDLSEGRKKPVQDTSRHYLDTDREGFSMDRFDHPRRRLDPYPENWSRLRGFSYRDPLVLVRLKDAVRLRTAEDADFITGAPFGVLVEVDRDVRQITVPPGLITDLTSVPVIARWIVGRVGPWLKAAIVHDYLYIAWQNQLNPVARDRDRLFADLVMLAGMKAARVSIVRRYAIFGAVRLFGGFGYRRWTRDRYADLSDVDCAFTLPGEALSLPGTLSMPEPPQGLQRLSLRSVSHPPRSPPCCRSASSA